MERYTASGDRGFTLIELLVVMAIIATLMTLVTPQYFRQHTKAQETVLRHNLSTLRQALDQYREDHGANPDSLQALVDRRYLREIPMDPLTGKRDTHRQRQPALPHEDRARRRPHHGQARHLATAAVRRTRPGRCAQRRQGQR